MTLNAGENFFQPYPAISKTPNVGGNLTLIRKEQRSIRPLKSLEIRKNLWMKKEENLDRSLMMQRISLEERLKKQNSSRETQLGKQKIKLHELHNKHHQQSVQQYQEQSHLLLIKLRPLKTSWLMVKNL